MKKVLSMLLALTMLVCLCVPVMADAMPDSGYSLFVVIDGLSSGSAEISSVSHIQSDTPYYVLPENPDTVREGQKFLGYYCGDTDKYYQIGDSIPLADFTLKSDGYWIYLRAAFSEAEKPDITYTDINNYSVKLNIVSPVQYESVIYTESYPYDPATDEAVGVVAYPAIRQCRQLAQYPNKGLSPAGYRSIVTGNVFNMDDTYDLSKLPAAEFVGTELNEISETEGERIHKYAITDYLIPLYSFYGATGAFLDPLYECSIIYYVPDPISNSADSNAPLGTVGTQTVTGITMDELTAPDALIKLDDAPEYTGYVFDGYSLLTETEVTVPDDHQILLSEQEYMNDSAGHIRLSMKLHYSIDPNSTPGIQNTITYAPNNGSLTITGSAPADENLYSLGAPFKVMGQGTLDIDGYEFIGWNTKADGSGTLYHENDIAIMTEAAILYAQWKPEGSILVSMSGNGGSFGSGTSKDLYMIPNTAFVEAEGYEEPAREGYNFIGWASTPGADAPDITAAPSSDNTAVYAVWSRKTDVKVTFDALNGSNPTEETGTFEASLTVPADPTRTGYSFGGWNTKADGTGNLIPAPAVFPGKDTTYYALWIPNEITVQFFPGEGGTIISGTTETKLHTGETLWDVAGFTFPEIESEHPYTFLGWRSNSGEFYDADHDTVQMVMNHIFTGAQNPETFTAEYSKLGQTKITFDYAGGTDSDGAAYKTFTDYEYTRFDESLVPTPARPGYLFKGWDADIPTEYPVVGNTVTLNALWEDVRHSVTFEMNGHGTAPAEQRVIDGNTANKPGNPAESGWTFDGWYADATCNVAFDFDSKINADTTIYANWTCNDDDYEIRNAKEATCTEDGYTGEVYCKICGEKITIGQVIPATGHTYGEWVTTKEATETETGTKERICSACGDKDRQEIPVLTPVTYSIISGANGEWTKGNTDGLIFISDAPFGKFVGVKVDGAEIAATNYTAVSGSTKVTLKVAYLETLSEGSHSFEIVSNDGSAYTNFTVKDADPTDLTNPVNPTDPTDPTNPVNPTDPTNPVNPTDPTDPVNPTDPPKPADPASPQTDDNSTIYLWMLILAVSAAGLSATAIYSRKRKINNK